MKTIKTRERILVLKQVLEKYTDEENELSLSAIIDKLYQETDGTFSFTKGIIKEDLTVLEESNLIDLIVNQEMNGMPKYYSCQNRLFEIQELRLLIDAVVSARFINKPEKEKLLHKIKQLTSRPLAAKLENQIYIHEHAHSQSSGVKYAIYNLHNAINDKKVIQFQYGRYNIDKQFELSRNGKWYILHPYALVWNSDYYYLIGMSPENDALRHYRVDRIVNLTTTEEDFQQDDNFDPSDYTSHVFLMHTGVEKWIEIRFSNQLINVIIDRFGKEVPIRKDGDNHFILKTKAAISDGLFRWLLTWGNEAEVLNPPELKEKIKQESKKLYELYHRSETLAEVPEQT